MVLSCDIYTGESGYKKVLQVFVNEATELAYVEAGGEIITATTNHPFYVVGYGFLEAGRLQAGDRIRLANGEIQEIESVTIEHLEEPVRVYNFEVEDWHTYFVGEKGVLVHNDCLSNGITEEGEGRQLALPGPGETSVSSRRAAAEQKLADATKGSHGSRGIDFIGTDYGVSVHADQNAMENSLVRAGANGTGEYVYANGARITGTISRSDRAAIGHIHGQH